MELYEKYLNGLKEKMKKELPEDYEELKRAEGVSEEDLEQLLRAFPECPRSLVKILKQVDGTYHRWYQGESMCAYMFGSDVESGEYPYFLLSAKEMLESVEQDEDVSYLEEYGDEAIDPRIKSDGMQAGKYIHFANCMNDGGTSRLYIDFDPSEKGTYGQVVRFVHDEDEYMVLANNFDEYLEIMMRMEYAFIKKEEDFDVFGNIL